MPATQKNRDVLVKCALADDVLLFRSMHCSEQLGQLFAFRVELSSKDCNIDIAEVLGKDMTIVVNTGEDTQRYFNGIVTRFTFRGWRDDMASYEAVVHPALWLLTRSIDCRIFQDKNAVDIVKEVCGNQVYGGVINLDVSGVSGEPVVRSYCVQYRESDFDFVCRLLQEEGIYFYFKHTKTGHSMVLADSYGAHDAPDDDKAVKFIGAQSSREIDNEVVTIWMQGGEIQASWIELNDYDFEKSGTSHNGGLTAMSKIPAAFSQSEFKQYDYPGGYDKPATGNALARARMESIHGQSEEIHAGSDSPGLACGVLFKLTDHPRDKQNREYLITGAQTTIVGNDYVSGGGNGGVEFSCSFTAVGKEHSYRPPRRWQKPSMRGPQTAMVVGKDGEEIWTDKYGRIKVQFHWDQIGKEDENSSCWVRVSQAWAGKGWGAMFIPRVGMEVVVDFLDGDPDRPLVTGCVYNSDAMPPYALPEEQTKSGIKTNSSKGGEGNNQLRFEDKKGEEEIFIQAEKDYNRVVKNNDTLKVGFEKADKGDQTIQIKNDQSVEIGNNQTITIKADQKIDVTKTIVIEAGTSIELKVGGSSIKIEAAKITIKSAEIAIESDANTTIKAGAMMSVKSGAVMTIEGALVKIN